MVSYKNIIILAYSLLTASVSSVAQTEQFDISYPYSNHISKISLDSTGYLWFHDDKDFYKYNGHQASALGLSEIINKSRDEYLLYGQIIFIQDSILFLNDNKVSIVDPETKYVRDVWQLPGRNYFKYIYQDELGHIWVFASTYDGLSQPVYKSTDRKTFVEVFDLNDYVGEGGVFWTYYELDDKDGKLYFLWRRGDVLILDEDGNEIQLDVADEEEFMSTKACSQFRLDNNKNLWRIYEQDFGIYNEETKSFDAHSLTGKMEFTTDCKIQNQAANKREGLADVGSMLNLRFLFVDSQDRVWLGCAASYLICFDPATSSFTNFRKELVDNLEGGDNDIYEMFEDDTGNIWGIKKGGLFKVRDNLSYFDSYLVNTGDANHPIYSQFNDNATFKSVLNFYNDYAVRNTAVHSIQEDDTNNLVFQEGVYTYRLNPSSRELEVLPFFSPYESVHISYQPNLKVVSTWNNYYKLDANFNSTKVPQPLLAIENTLVQQNGNIWFSGLLSKKSYLFASVDPESLDFQGNVQDPEGNINFGINKVQSMDEDESGNLWLGTHSGLIYYNTKLDKFKSYTNRFSYKDDSIGVSTQIEKLKYVGDNNLWFSTKNELAFLNVRNQKIRHYLKFDESSASEHIQILPFGDSVVWIGNAAGLVYHNFSTKQNIRISSEEGLQTKGAVNVLKKISDNKIAVGTNNGLYIYHPDTLLKNYLLKQSFQQDIAINLNSFTIMRGKNDELERRTFIEKSENSIELSYDDRMLEFDYSLVNFDYTLYQPLKQSYLTTTNF